MTRPNRVRVIVALAMGCLGYVLSPVLPFFQPTLPPVDSEDFLRAQRRARSYSWLKTLSMAMEAYEVEFECLPYHKEGPEAAMYLLRQYALPEYALSHPRGAEMFDAQNPDMDINGPAFFDDAHKRVENADYDYINGPGLSLRTGNPSLIILAEKAGVRENSKRYLTLSGNVGEYSLAPGGPADVVGRSRPP